jgi:hypothetical protein
MVRNQFKVVVSSDVPSLVGLGKSRFVGYSDAVPEHELSGPMPMQSFTAA